MTDNQQSPVTQDERSPAQFFFEMGFGACYAEAMIRNGNQVPFPLTDAEIERQWALSREAYDDPAELDVMLARLSTTGPGVGRLREAAQAVLDNADRAGSRMCFEGGPNGEDIWIDHQEVDQPVLDALAAALEPRTADGGEVERDAKGAPISDWSWWVGSDETVSEEGLYDIYEAGTRDDAIGWAECNVGEGEIFHIIEARTRALQGDDEFMPFVARRNAMSFEVSSDGVAVEVAALATPSDRRDDSEGGV